MTNITEAAIHWNDFASAELERGAYEASRGSSPIAHLHRAATARRTVVALFLESLDGAPRCSCCHRTDGERAARRGST